MSVRQLVEFLLRSGDLDSRGGGPSAEIMLEGARIHRKLQREAGASYQAEVPLKIYYPIPQMPDDACLLLEGRADGVYEGVNPDFPLLGEAWTVDEIKSTYGKLSGMKEPVPVHLAQARCYAYMLAERDGLQAVRVRMTYYSLATEAVRYFYEDLTGEEIRAWFEELMEEFGRWARMELEWKEVRTRSLQALSFPFSYRPGQRELAVHVYHTICHGTKLFLQAPTGTGKTLSVLFPSLKAMGEDKADKIFYLTAKTVTASVAADALALLRERGLRLKSVVLTAKEKACILEKPDCTPETCPRARGHFDRVNEALYDLLTGQEAFDREAIDSCAQKYNVCPFELGLDLTLFSDAVIGDYNYLFDPRAKLRRFFAEGVRSPYLFLVDEAHNLVDRGREMYSAGISLSSVTAFRSAVRASYRRLWERTGPCLSVLRGMAEETEAGTRVLGEIDDLAQTLRDVYEEIQAILAEQRKKERLSARRSEVQETLLQFFFELRHFMEMYDGMEDDYVIYAERPAGKERADIRIRLYCVDPSRNLRACMEAGTASVLFSATLLPVQYYKRLLGGEREDYEVCAPPVFDPERRAVLLAQDVTTRYRDRGEDQYARIAAYIYGAVSQRHGNYLLFFPSYAFMEEVFNRFAAAHPEDGERTYALQRQNMTAQEREDFLRRFEEVRDDRSLLGFCVLGGVFSEGIDLRRDRLIGVVVVGTGFPQVCAEREILKEYFAARGEDGFAYAYRIPGMNKVLQAAGRVIRTQEDVGVIVLADSRFLSGAYRRLFPPDWGGGEVVTAQSVGDRISRFWDEWL